MGRAGGHYWRTALLWTAMGVISYIFWRWLVWYLLPFVVAIALTFLISPWVDRIEGLGLARAWAVLASLAAALLVFFVLCGSVLSLLAAELLQISHRLPHYLKDRPLEIGRYLQQWNDLRRQLGIGSGNLGQEWDSLYHLAAYLARGIARGLVQLPELALILLVASLAAFFMLRDQRQVRRAVRTLAPPPWRHRIGPLSAAMVGGLFGYMRAEFALVALTGLATMGGLLICRAPYAVLIGLTAGLLDMVPFMGPTILLVPWALGALATGNLGLAIRLVGVLAGVALVRQTAEPRLVGRGTGLHPLVVLFSLYIGIRLFGAGGVLVGPVTAVMFKAIAQVMADGAYSPPKSG